MDKSSRFLVGIGSLFLAVVLVSEIFSARRGLGPYQITLVIYGVLFLLLGIFKHNLVRNMLLIVLSILLTLSFVEVALRLMPPPAPFSPVVPDPELRERPIPAQDTDASGWRNERIPDNIDFIAIGDSLTWGLNAKASDSWSVAVGDITGLVDYQMAFPRYGPAQYMTLTHEALELAPKQIIIGLYFGNDFLDATAVTYDLAAYSDFRLEEVAALIPPEGVTETYLGEYNAAIVLSLLDSYMIPSAFSNPFLANTATGRFLAARMRTRAQEINALRQIAREHPQYLLAYENGDVLTFLTTGRRWAEQDMQRPLVAEGLRLTEEYLLAIQEMTDTAGVDLLLVALPTTEWVYADLVEERDAVYEQMVAAESEMRTRLFGFLNEQEIAYVDSAPCLQAAARENQIIYSPSFDGHPNGLGYKAIAECVAQAFNVP